MSAPVTALFARLRPAPSIRNKLVGLSFAFLLAIVMLIFVLVQTQQKELLQTQWAESMAAQARLLASNSQAAVAFNDKYEANRLLSSLAINPAILASRTVLPSGKTLGEFRNREDFLRPFPPGEAGSRFLDDILIVREPILTPGQAIPTGHIELMVSLEQYHLTMRRTLLQTAGVLALALAVLLIASRYFVSQLTAPLEKLDELANHISRDATLDQRLGIERNDEIGSLAKSFDRMLDSLQHRDRELARYRDSLESMVAARTRELQAAMEESRQASRAKSDFLARMSHEIRTPMNAIIGLNHMVLDSELAPQQREYLEQVLHSAENLLVIINDILDYSKIEAGRLTLEHQNFEPAKVFQSLQTMFATRAQAKGIDFTIDVDPAVPPVVVGDSLRLGQVLINLVGNALKFTESGTVAVHATLHAPAADHRVRIDFVASDTGIGIDAEHLAHLFTPFTQADSSITRRFGGTGLGLAICQQLIELMGGHIDVESAPGRGSTFRFSVELGIPEPGSDTVGDAARLPDGQAAAAQPRWNGERILLVEDVPLNRTVAVALLKKAGLDVAVAADGQEALDRLAGEDFRLVLMDIQMPVMDGLTATRALRAEPRFRDLPVIAMTAHASGEDKRLSEEAGMNAHLTKPIIPRLLYETIGRWLPPQES